MSKKQNLTEELFRIHEMMGLTENQLELFSDEDAGSEEEIPTDEVSEEGLVGKKVMVYYNLHKHVFSVTYKGLVKSYSDYVKLKDVEFRVRKGGNEKVRDEKKKNVHAFVIGTLVDHIESPSDKLPEPTGSKTITYNPYKYSSFVYQDSEEPVYNAKEVELINRPSDKIFQISESVGTPISEDIISEGPKLKDYLNKLGSKFDVIKDNLKQEGAETLDILSKLIDAAKGKKLSNSDKQEIGDQLKDLLKLSGLAAISVLPGGIIAAILIKFFKKESWITPSSFKDNPISLSEESNLSYTSEKVDELIIEAQKVVDKGNSLIKSYGMRILNSTLLEVHDEMSKFESDRNDLNSFEKKIRAKFDYYYDVANSFDYMDWPDNVKTLDGFVNKLDDIVETLDDLVEVYDDLIDKVERLSKYGTKLFDK